MRGRFGRLSDPARQVATVAASLGRRFALDDVAAMLGLQPSALLIPVEELIHSNLFVESRRSTWFSSRSHARSRAWSVPISVRRALDRQAALVLLAGGALPVEVAIRLASSAESGDEMAVTTLLKAAEMLGQTDPSAAADLSLTCAGPSVQPKHLLRGPLVAGTAVWLHAAGRGAEAKSFADTALRQVLPAKQEADRSTQHRRHVLHISRRTRGSVQGSSRPQRPPARHPSPSLGTVVPQPLTAGRTGGSTGRSCRRREPRSTNATSLAGRFVLELAESGLAYGTAGSTAPSASSKLGCDTSPSGGTRQGRI